ncbi:MAG: hypothetical protein V1792_09490, partial [Pseudomonadota bacterium]
MAPRFATVIRLEKSLGSSITMLPPKPPQRVPDQGQMSEDLHMKRPQIGHVGINVEDMDSAVAKLTA